MAEENASDEIYDLLILVDATSSMYYYLDSLKTSLPQVIAISNLTDSFSRIGVLAYRDYTEAGRNRNGLLEWSGWYDQHNVKTENENENRDASGLQSIKKEALMSMASAIEPTGGGDFPEATKTGLARAYELMREDATTIILLYTDAPPHCRTVAEKGSSTNFKKEQAALSTAQSYGGFGPQFADWVSAANQLHKGARKAQVFCFLDPNLRGNALYAGFYTYLSTMTRGACLYLTDTNSYSIAQVTVDILLAWMGVEKAGAENNAIPAKMMRYKDVKDIKKAKNEKDAVANSYFWARNTTFSRPNAQFGRNATIAQDHTSLRENMEANVAEATVDAQLLKKHLSKKKTPLGDFAKRYERDEQYKKLVTEQLEGIIQQDVSSMSLNPVFGTLWRAVCNDRENSARDELVKSFSSQIDMIKNAETRAKMRNWLEESYDFAAEILEDLERAPESQRFPCVFLDPTTDFQRATQSQKPELEDEEEDDRPITSFRRDELLEIGRSCDGRVLRRLGKVLTRLTYVESLEDLPPHIESTTNAEVPRIPLSFASQDAGWKFWKILLHVVLPGTKLSARPSVVLAALAIRIGLKPLFGAACAAVMFWRDRWNNIETPENWSAGCLGLLLDADNEYQRQKEVNDEKNMERLLHKGDRELFSRLLAYHYAGLNIHTTLTAEIGWAPEKSQAPIGYVVKCRTCKFPRSVTIMNSNGRCGLCEASDWNDANHKTRATAANVTNEDTAVSNLYWVECNVRTCRAQYVCYNPDDLRVRAKCYYCRVQSKLPQEKKSNDPAPTLECTKCLSKIIWPKPWQDAAPTPFNCPACMAGINTIEQVETNAQQITKENGDQWLLQDKSNTIKEPFKKSIFQTVSAVTPQLFVDKITVLPAIQTEFSLVLRGKRIQNQSTLLKNLWQWIETRTSERTPCSLCFTSIPNKLLLPACRRAGCNQLICKACLDSWYGLNASGAIINTAALFCPFCRRPPSARTLSAYGKGVHAVVNLMKAVQERGKWIYAWCTDCGTAERYMEQECARGAPPAIREWRCETCVQSEQERARVAMEEALAALQVAETQEIKGQEQRAAMRRYEREQRRIIRLSPTRICPRCKVLTEKDGGCNHMACPCGADWCWCCGGEYDEDGMLDHFANDHGGWGYED
ncbi:unnamed protein product [Periconia digitata]|uniref:RBR-type E3 ubiquitin transferase n=1 Tax=Periconia digitata TaxID=1303443 RepID=A0A9W4UKI7_9PLEO|nr:unnamed protein product [Periconia digitata]